MGKVENRPETSVVAKLSKPRFFILLGYGDCAVRRSKVQTDYE
jgi:hypothetical protein